MTRKPLQRSRKHQPMQNGRTMVEEHIGDWCINSNYNFLPLLKAWGVGLALAMLGTYIFSRGSYERNEENKENFS
jgi:hypothetical protein